MIQAYIIDDEFNSIQLLKLELEAYCPEIKVIDSFNDPIMGLKAIEKNAPDLLFLDIEMPGLNGFELLASLDQIKFDVIFITAYDQFAIKAFEFNAVDYLLKPVLKPKLLAAVQKIVLKQEHAFPETELKALINNIQVHSSSGFEKIALPTSDGFEFVHKDDIMYLQGESNYSWAFIENGKKYLIAKTLKELSSMIPFSQFYRVHKSYFVNLNHAIKYIRGSGGYLVMKSAVQIPVSRSQKPGLMEKLGA